MVYNKIKKKAEAFSNIIFRRTLMSTEKFIMAIDQEQLAPVPSSLTRKVKKLVATKKNSPKSFRNQAG